MSLIPGVNIINWSRPTWEDADWNDIDDKIYRASCMGLRMFQIWVHFNYANIVRDPAGNLRLTSRFIDAVCAHAPSWPGEVLFDWSWGYYGDGLAEDWANDLIAGRFNTLAQDWNQLLDDLGDERFSLSVGNEMDGLLRKSGAPAHELASALAGLKHPFTCGWRNEHSFDGPLLQAAQGKILRYSHYESNEGWAADAGPLEGSAVVCSGHWGVAEFGLNSPDTIDEAIDKLRVRIHRFAALGARDVLLWALGAGDQYRWQLEHSEYVAAFVQACNGHPAPAAMSS